MPKFELITELRDLKALVKDLLKEDVIAVDTEADSFYHYFEKTCLIQIATRKNAWLIDPLALGGPAELKPLAPIFADPKIRIIFHAAEYDIFILKRDCGFSFTNLFDTMMSAQLLGYPFVGLAALIEHHFDKLLPKDEQKSDWSRRPLTEKQLQYAVTDVIYLIRLTEKLERELTQKKRLSWAQHEFGLLVDREWPERSFDELGYLRIKGAKLLDPVSLSVLRELFLTRDARAREIDRPPFKVLGNRTLLELARERPTNSAGLIRIKGVTDLTLRRMGSDLIKAIQKGSKSSHGPIPKQTNGTTRRRMDKQMERRLSRLKAWRAPRSKELEIDPGVLVPNAALEAIAIANPQTAEALKGIPAVKTWFAESFAQEVLPLVSGPASESTANSSGAEGSSGSRQGESNRKRGASKPSAKPDRSK